MRSAPIIWAMFACLTAWITPQCYAGNAVCPDSWHLLSAREICYRAFNPSTKKTFKGSRGFCRKSLDADPIFSSATSPQLMTVFDTGAALRDMAKRNDTPFGQFRIDGYQGRYEGKVTWLQFNDQKIPRNLQFVLAQRANFGTLTVKPTSGNWYGKFLKDKRLNMLCQVPVLPGTTTLPPTTTTPTTTTPTTTLPTSVTDAGWCSAPQTHGGDLPGGSILSPRFPSAYPRDVFCEYNLEGPSDEGGVQWFFSLPYQIFADNDPTEDPETCDKDFLTLYDGADDLEPTDGPQCGLDVFPDFFLDNTTVTNKYMTFTSDGTQEFQGSYFFIYLKVDCGGIIDVTSGPMDLTALPNTLSNNTRMCVWSVRAPDGYSVTADLSSVTGSVSTRSFIFLDGDSFFRFVPRYRYQDKIEPVSLVNTEVGNAMTIIYRENANTPIDFAMTVDKAMIDRTAAMCTNDTALSGSSGTLVYPGDGYPYNRETQCSWRITIPSGTGDVALKFLKFGLDTIVAWDNLAAYETSGHFLYRWDMDDDDRPPTVSDVDTIFDVRPYIIFPGLESIDLVFRSDSAEEGYGFEIDWMTATTSSQTTTNCRWVGGDFNTQLSCDPTEVLAGVCSSMDSPACNGTNVEIKCCGLSSGTVSRGGTSYQYQTTDGEDITCQNEFQSQFLLLRTICQGETEGLQSCPDNEVSAWCATYDIDEDPLGTTNNCFWSVGTNAGDRAECSSMRAAVGYCGSTKEAKSCFGDNLVAVLCCPIYGVAGLA